MATCIPMPRFLWLAKVGVCVGVASQVAIGSPAIVCTHGAVAFCPAPHLQHSNLRHCASREKSGPSWRLLHVHPACSRYGIAARIALGADKRSGRDTGGSRIVDATLLAAIEDGDALAVQSSLAAGASPLATDEWGTTCLYAAVKTGQTEVVRLLLGAGADPDFASASDDETTPLHIAAQKGFQTIAALLLESGATATKADEFGDMPIDIARRANNKPLVQLLKGKSVRATVVDDGRGNVKPPGLYRDKSYTEFGGEQMQSSTASKLVENAVDWDAAELGRDSEEGSVVEMVIDPETGDQFLRRVPLKQGARQLFPDVPLPPPDSASD